MLYNLIFVLPLLLVLAGHAAFGDRAGGLLERVRDRLAGDARAGMPWLLGLVGFFLVTDALARLGVAR